MQKHPLAERTLRYIEHEHLIARHDRILAAVSGGADSVALLHLLAALAEPLGIAQLTVVHFDHQLRGEASSEDRRFVEALAERLDLPCITGTEDVAAFQHNRGISLEMAARSCRHRFFRQTLSQLSACAVALGHTANDQAEELLLRLLRGTGPAGMAGMAPRTEQGLIRPLLFATRREIVDFLDTFQLQYREDLSNQDPFCQRNLLRLEVFPLLERAFHDKIVNTLSRHARLAREEEDHWNSQLRGLWPALCAAATTTRVDLKLSGLLQLQPVLLRRVLRFAMEQVQGNLLGLGTVHLEMVSRWLHRTGSGKTLHLPGQLWVLREGEIVAVTTQEPFSQEPFRWEIPSPGTYTFPPLRLHISLCQRSAAIEAAGFGTGKESACLDAATLHWPLVIRSWQPGDRFHPLGLGGSKKLQDFFTDRKISRAARYRIPLLCDQEKICWIIGHRLDERVKVTPATRQLLVVEASVR